MFSVLNEQEKEIVTMAMEEKKFEFLLFFFKYFFQTWRLGYKIRRRW